MKVLIIQLREITEEGNKDGYITWCLLDHPLDLKC
jgi:hypothetical protein